jgi:hypothetical protein
MMSLDDGRLIRIAEELAMRIEPAAKVLARHEVTPAEYAVLRTTPAFRTHLREALSRWQSPAMAPERIAAKAVTLVESALPGMAGIIEDDKAPAAARVGAFGQIRALSGLGDKDREAGREREKFVLNIVLGQGASGVTLEGSVLAPSLPDLDPLRAKGALDGGLGPADHSQSDADPVGRTDADPVGRTEADAKRRTDGRGSGGNAT